MFHGSMVALVTPMFEDGSVDYNSLSQLLEFHIEAGTDAIVSVGTTGESATLSEKEHCEVVRQTAAIVNGRIPVIAGTGSNSTQEAIQLSECAMNAGADGLLLVTPYYNKPTQAGLIAHYRAIAAAVALPQILYNVPGRTACDMLPETVEVLSSVSNIVGIKEASGSVERAKDIIQRCGDRLDLYSGDDALGVETVKVGGKGVISVTANVAPKQMHEIYAAALAGDFERAAKLDEQLAELHDKLFVEANPIPVKWALMEMGLIGKGIRLPLTEMSSEHHQTVRGVLQRAGLI